MINIEIGPFEFAANIGGNSVVRSIAVRFSTPWFDGGLDGGYNRERHIQACVICGLLPKKCECDEPVLVNPIEVQDALLRHDHDLYHHLTGTTCGEEEEPDD